MTLISLSLKAHLQFFFHQEMSIHQEFNPQLISLGFILGHSCWPTDTPLGPVSSHQAFFPNEGEKQMSIDAFHHSTPKHVCASHEWSASEPFPTLPWFLQKLGCLEVGCVRQPGWHLQNFWRLNSAGKLRTSPLQKYDKLYGFGKDCHKGKLGLKLCYCVGLQHSFPTKGSSSRVEPQNLHLK